MGEGREGRGEGRGANVDVGVGVDVDVDVDVSVACPRFNRSRILAVETQQESRPGKSIGTRRSSLQDFNTSSQPNLFISTWPWGDPHDQLGLSYGTHSVLMSLVEGGLQESWARDTLGNLGQLISVPPFPLPGAHRDSQGAPGN